MTSSVVKNFMLGENITNINTLA